jgi:hypothetical protein
MGKRVDPEQLKGEKVIREMKRLERRRKHFKFSSILPWVIVLVLIGLIAFALWFNWARFSLLWERLMNPGEIPGVSS